MNMGLQIKEARIRAKMTQRGLAEKAGVATGTIQQYELDKRQPRLEQLQAIANVLNVPWTQLAGDDSFDVTVGRVAAKKIKAEVETREAVLSLISRLHGSVEDKEVSTNIGSANYYLVGTGSKSFVLYDFDIKTLEEAILNMISPIVDRLKDIRDEYDIIEEIKGEIDSDESKAAIRKALEVHKKRFPQYAENWGSLETLLSEPPPKEHSVP